MSNAAEGSFSDGPVVSLVTKKLRALRKKLEKVTTLEQKVTEGKAINSEQQAVLDSKASILILVDEYEKLKDQLASAVEEEKAAVISKIPAPVAEDPVSAEPQPPVEPEVKEPEVSEEKIKEIQDAANAESVAKLKSILNLLYFAQLFDVTHRYHAIHTHVQKMERHSCLSYDAYDLVAPGPELEQRLDQNDLDNITEMGKLITSRPQGLPISHKDAIERCAAIADKWMARSDEKLPDFPISFGDLAGRLQRILNSDYFTQVPVVQEVTEHTARAAAEAQAAVHRHSQMAQFEPPHISADPGPLPASEPNIQPIAPVPVQEPGMFYAHQAHPFPPHLGQPSQQPALPQFGFGFEGEEDHMVTDGPILNFTNESKIEVGEEPPMPVAADVSAPPPEEDIKEEVTVYGTEEADVGITGNKAHNKLRLQLCDLAAETLSSRKRYWAKEPGHASFKVIVDEISSCLSLTDASSVKSMPQTTQ
eukprot:gene3879-4840_t